MTSRLILPLPPSVNHSHHNINRGGRLMKVKSAATKDFILEAGWATKIWMKKAKWIRPEWRVKVVLNIWIYWPDNRKRDSDNLMKILLDSLKGIAFEDDRQALPRIMDFAVDQKNPRLEIELRAMEVV